MRRVIFDYEGALRVLVPRDGTIRTTPDRELGEASIYADARLAEHCEMDCGGGTYDGLCDGCQADMEFLRATRRLDDERRADGKLTVIVEDPDAPTLEERLGPYGIEWQLEQRERAEGR